MPFHLEIRRNFHRAWAFNLTADELARTVLDRWRQGSTIELGGRDWTPGECGLTVIEGPELDGPALAYGRGWGSAQRSGTDVTARLLASGPTARVAVLAQAPQGAAAAAALIAELGLAEDPWLLARRALLSAGAIPGSAAAAAGVSGVLIMCSAGSPPAGWVFDAGLALGGFGAAAVVLAATGVDVPAELGDVAVVRLEQNPAEEIAARLSAAIAPGGFGLR